MFRNGVNGYHNAIGFGVFFSQIKKAEKLLKEANEKKLKLSNENEIKQAGLSAREFFINAIGGIPNDNSDLNPRIIGQKEYEKYTLRKVIYQSLSNYYVTANLYIPKEADFPAPGILLCCGHSRGAKVGYSPAADILARNGFVALVFDPPGQGERLNLIDRRTGVQKVQWGTREHSWLGLISFLNGQCIARYFIRDGMRGIDYLVSLPEVDENKIGVTGTSGGGTQSCYLALVDDRVSAVAPSCYVTDRLTYMKMFHPHDAEQNIFGHIPQGFDYCDFFLHYAPKPLLFLGVRYDFFPIEGLLNTYNIVKEIYTKLGKPENCKIYIDDTIHSFSPTNQRKVVQFFADVFLGKDKSELDLEEGNPPPADELNCTKSGQILIDFPDTYGLDKKIVDEIPTEEKLSEEELREHIRKLVYHNREIEPIYPRVIETVNVNEYKIEKMFFFSEKDIALTAVMIRPISVAESEKLKTYIALLGDGTNQLRSDDEFTRLFGICSGCANIFVLDVRGIGCARIRDVSNNRESYKSMYETLFKIAYNYWMLGDNLVCARAFDVVRAIEYLRSRNDVGEIEIYGEDDLGFVGLLSAVADGKIKSVILKGMPKSYREEVSKIYYNRSVVNEWTTIHGMLRYFDVPDLCKLIPNCRWV